ncbi:hypothetical protein KR093_006419 [Drosophila rubida]|uniref:Gustatory receptor n=1 Tax=Drosophila rubida TaxID=30044 RepID=A0AAD4PFZ7_9MUSC|nr:hypothetical protein KR093_006419 [Drosophila rubida]
MLAMVFPTLLIRLSRVVGLCNLRFVAESGRFQRQQGPMLIYCIALHLIYVLFMSCGFLVLVSMFFNCQGINMLAVAYSVVAVSKVLSILLLICGIWLLRDRWLQLVNGFLALQQLYRSDLIPSSLSQWLRHARKTLMCFSKILSTIYWIFGPNNYLMCSIDDQSETRIYLIYIGITIVAVPLEMFFSGIDYWIYHLTSVSNWLIDCLTLEAQELKQDVGRMPQRHGCHRNVHQQQLLGSWKQLWRRCLRLHKVYYEMIAIFQWQMLLNILTNYLSDITSIFHILIYWNEPQVLNRWYFTAYWIICILFHLDIMSFFAIFDAHRLKWEHLQQQVHELWLSLDAMENVYCVALYRQIEFSIILVNRRLQRCPKRVRRLHIAGLFDINRRSEYCMSTSIAMNVLILWQIAYKYYY